MPRTTTQDLRGVRQQVIAEIKDCLRRADEAMWRAADLIYQLAGEPKKLDPRLAAVADELEQSVSFCATLRKLAMTFPPETRTFQVPWSAYKDVMNAAEDKEEILRRVEAAIASGARRPSGQLVHELTTEVLKEKGLAPLRFSRRTKSRTELLARQVRLYREALLTGEEVPSLEDARDLRKELNATATALSPGLRHR